MTISRTGYTGDLGYEIWMDAADALPVWDALIEAGDDFGITACGILAMDMARVEAGLFMLDVDYTAATHAWIAGQKSSPYEMGLGWTVALDKPGYFVGRRALEREAREGSAWKMVGLEVRLGRARAPLRRGGPAAADPRHGGAHQPAGAARTASRWATPRRARGRRCSRSTSRSCTCERPHYEPGTRVEIEITVEHHRRYAPATVVALPFYDPEWKRK